MPSTRPQNKSPQKASEQPRKLCRRKKNISVITMQSGIIPDPQMPMPNADAKTPSRPANNASNPNMQQLPVSSLLTTTSIAPSRRMPCPCQEGGSDKNHTCPVHPSRLSVSRCILIVLSSSPLHQQSKQSRESRAPVRLARRLSNSLAQGRSLASAILKMVIPTNSSHMSRPVTRLVHPQYV